MSVPIKFKLKAYKTGFCQFMVGKDKSCAQMKVFPE